MVAGTTVATAQGNTCLVFSSRDSNDLYRVTRGMGWECPRFDTPEDAVRNAPEGCGVLILADAYPDATTRIPESVYAEAARRRLRLFVEYPASLPGFDFGEPRHSRIERAVVVSDFFGPELKKMRILAINGMTFLPTSADRAHVVAARVAGFDTAVYGLPPESFPILFEHPGGNVLASTTKLSHFVTGRFAPVAAWQALWSGVLAWLQPGKAIPRLEWTPLVRPAYSRDAKLPDDFQLQALRRGGDWFINSGLLLHPSRLDEVKRAAEGNGLVPPPPPGSPVGDGSLGILEAPLSVIRSDGSQMQGVARRGDCTAESAMALAFAGRIQGDAAKLTIASNLLDFYLFESEARKGGRGDPDHGAYGLTAWGVSSPAWLVANYGDDNARLMLGTLATAALTGHDRWDEALAMCLLANLRTTGVLGFRGGRIDVGQLDGGWQPFFTRRILNPSPHYEAYLWACFLRAYAYTGDDLFLDRAETAIRLTMARHTDGWQWTNGLAQERARMLLPLAWLVRVDDTAEHRRWLRQAADGLIALQDECGAIREELGRPGMGAYPPPQSNEAYGGNEASLIQQNGDPVSDLLYTTNFAFLGLHEAAAATGDEKCAEAENRLAEFLCRIQIRSDARPELDGGWFRAFDFRRWEHWASNADVGWGAWAIESGWTQGWITSVLAMRHMRTSLWDLTSDCRVKRYHAKYRAIMLPADELRKAREAIALCRGRKVVHDAVGKPVEQTTPVDPRYPGCGLTDGMSGTATSEPALWHGFQGRDFEATLDLGEVKPIRSVSANFLQAVSAGIILPVRVEVALSEDGTHFRTLPAAKHDVPEREPGPLTRMIGVLGLKERARYVRVRARSIGKLPAWHVSAGIAGWLFVDEILVNAQAAGD